MSHCLKDPEVADGSVPFKWQPWPKAMLQGLIWSGIMYFPCQERRTALSSIPGWVGFFFWGGGIYICLKFWLYLAMLRILFFFKWSQISTCFSAVVAVRVQIQQVEGWWLVSGCHGYCAVLITSKSLASPSFSVTFSYLYHPPCTHFEPLPVSSLPHSTWSSWTSSTPPPSCKPLLFDLVAFVIAFLLSCEI